MHQPGKNIVYYQQKKVWLHAFSHFDSIHDYTERLNTVQSCTTVQSSPGLRYLQFLWGVNVFADFIPKTGCWIRQCWFYWPLTSESLIYLCKLTRHRRGADTTRSFFRSCVSCYFLSVFGVAMASVLQYFSGQQNSERRDSIYNNSKPIVTFMKVWLRCRLFCDLCGQ